MLDERIDCIRIGPDRRRAVPLLAAFTPRRIHPIWRSNQASPPGNPLKPGAASTGASTGCVQ